MAFRSTKQKPSQAEEGSKQKGKKPKAPKEKTINFFKLFKYTSCCEKLILIFGCIMAGIAGFVGPAIAIVYGMIIDVYQPGASEEEINAGIQNLVIFGIVASLIIWFGGYCQYALMQHVAERISFDLRGRYLKSLLNQEIQFFEEQNIEALPSQLSMYFETISEGVGQKVANLIYTFTMLVGGLTVGFIYGPVLTGICLLYIPIFICMMLLLGCQAKKTQIIKIKQLELLGAHTEETMSAIKLVQSFAKEDLATDKYVKIAKETELICKKAAKGTGCLQGIFLTSMFGFFLYAYAIGSVLLEYKHINPATGKEYTVMDIVIVAQSTIMAMMTFGGLIPIYPAIVRALVCGQKVFDVIERVPKIATPKTGAQTDIQLGKGIVFTDVYFRYPTAIEKSHDTYQGVNFVIKAGTSTAIVGPSGSGKSTIVQLINRFYDPKQGKIEFDLTDLKDLSLKSLRETIGYVSQEPVLILGTIRENLLYGNMNATEAEIKTCLEQANAEFVYKLEKGLDSYVGAASVMNLSGGQKQRIAIARALIRKPKILILDEATSALDSKCEAEVQAAIEKIGQEQGSALTIIMIAHRLSTIQTAENLLYLQDPKTVIGAQKDSEQYNNLIDKLKSTNYKHQNEPVSPLKREISSPMKQVDSQKAISTDLIQLETAGEASQAQQKNKVKQEKTTKGMARIMTYYKPYSMSVCMLFLACFCSFQFPTLGCITAFFQTLLFSHDTDPDFAWKRDYTAYGWLALCIFIGVITGTEKMLFGLTGEGLTTNVRIDLVKGIIYKQLCWFDSESKAPGVLTNVLSEDVTQLNGMTTELMAVMVEAALGFALSILIACYFSPRMAFWSTLCTPIILVGAWAQSRLQWGNKGGKSRMNQGQKVDVYEKASALMSDVIMNYRTVIAFGEKNTHQVIDKYEALLSEPGERRIKNAHIAGIFFGYSQCARIIFVALVFWIGGQIIEYTDDKPEHIYICIYVILTAAFGTGISLSNVPSMNKAKASADQIFKIIDEKSTLDVRQSHLAPIQAVEVGKICFQDVVFKYPTRETIILDKMNFEIQDTQKVALVGSSGCGKSTITNLLLRFYDIKSGKILLGDKPLEDYNVTRLREDIGFVMQEPILFNWTIKENIMYGNQKATDYDVRRAAMLANALPFIETDIEDLDKEDRIKKVIDGINTNLEGLKEKYGRLGCLKPMQDGSESEWIEKEPEWLQLVYDILSKADAKALQSIDNNTDKFIEFVDSETLSRKGCTWDDIIYKFEWLSNFDQQMLPIAQAQGENWQNAIQQAKDNYPYQFDDKTIESWIEEASQQEHDDQLYDSLVQNIEEGQTRHLSSRYERIESLTENFLTKDKPKNEIVLHDGFNKMCGLKGSKLSGGQKQRIAIARALIKNPKILILDEATSALDEQSQEIVQQALDRSMEGRTSIVIAHRLSTIRNCQKLLVLNKGKVVEEGTYDELSADQESQFYKLKMGMEM